MNSEDFIRGSVEDGRFTLTWKGILAVFAGTIVIGLLFLYFGKFELARPTLFSIAAVGIAVAVKWKLRRRVWFCAAFVTIAALHIPLILCVPWTTGWIPAFAMTPFLIADVALILAILKFLEKLFEKSTSTDVRASSTS
jgi:hypothetical protein